MRGGAALVDEAERDSPDRHFLIYPILFNYRHGLEIAMKWIVDQYGSHVDAYSSPFTTHDLWALWSLCKQIIVKVDNGAESDEAVRTVEHIVKEFHDLDKIGMAFRYSTNKIGTTIRLPTASIDLRNCNGGGQ
jgi:hypothetical protein